MLKLINNKGRDMRGTRRFSEAQFSEKDMERAVEIILNQLQKNLKQYDLVFDQVRTSDNFRKLRGQDIYSLKYEVFSTLRYSILLEFLWSGRNKGEWREVRIYTTDRKRPSFTLDVAGEGITKILRDLIDVLESELSVADEKFNKDKYFKTIDRGVDLYYNNSDETSDYKIYEDNTFTGIYVDTIYDEEPDGSRVFEIDDKMGILDKEFNIVVEPIYNEIVLN